jgi:hypothetical protein
LLGVSTRQDNIRLSSSKSMVRLCSLPTINDQLLANERAEHGKRLLRASRRGDFPLRPRASRFSKKPAFEREKSTTIGIAKPGSRSAAKFFARGVDPRSTGLWAESYGLK